MDQDTPYRFEELDEVFRVLSPDGYNVLDCHDRHSAEHYVELLNRAYRNGFKAGYRTGKNSG